MQCNKSQKIWETEREHQGQYGDFEKYLHQHARKYAHKTIEKPVEYIRCQIKQAILLIVSNNAIRSLERYRSPWKRI